MFKVYRLLCILIRRKQTTKCGSPKKRGYTERLNEMMIIGYYICVCVCVTNTDNPS